MAPIIQLIVLGYAATTDVKDIPLLVVDARSVGREPRARSTRFDASANFQIVDVVSGGDDVERHLEHGTAWMALTIPAGFGDRLSRRPRRPRVQVIADGTDSNSTGVALGYARSVVAALLAPRRLGRARAGRPARRADRRRHPRVVQPAPREPRVHGAGHRGAAAAGGDHQPDAPWRSCASARWARSSSST